MFGGFDADEVGSGGGGGDQPVIDAKRQTERHGGRQFEALGVVGLADTPPKTTLPPTTVPNSSTSSFVYPVRSLLAGVQPARDPVIVTAAPARPSTTPNASGSVSVSGCQVHDVPHAISVENRAENELVLNTRAVNAGFSLELVSSPRMSPYASTSDNYFPRTSSATVQEDTKRHSEHEGGSPARVQSSGEQPNDNGANANALGLHVPTIEGIDHLLPPADFSKTGIVHLPPLPTHPVAPPAPQTTASAENTSTQNTEAFPSGVSVGDISNTEGQTVQIAQQQKQEVHQQQQGLGTSLRSSGSDESDVSVRSQYVTFRFQHVQDADGFHVLTGREGTLTRCEDEPIHAPGAVQGFGVLIALVEDEETGNLVVRQVSENSTDILGLSPRYLFSLDCFTQVLPDSQAEALWDNVQFLHEVDREDGNDADDHPQVFLLSGWGEPGSASSEEDEDDSQEQSSMQLQLQQQQRSSLSSNRRYWTCWCAAHKPKFSQFASSANSKGLSKARIPDSVQSLIILEFELERDLYNPLYPPLSHGPGTRMTSGSESRSGGGSRGSTQSSNTGSLSTLSVTSSSAPTMSSVGSVSSTATGGSLGDVGGGGPDVQDQEQVADNEDAVVGGANNQGGGLLQLQQHQQQAQELSADHTSNQSTSLGLNPAELFYSTRQGLEGDEQWYPNVEDVLESTTSHSKPLRALERMRRINRAENLPRRGATIGSGSGSSNNNNSNTYRPRFTRRNRQAGIGTMDIFAVLAQVNDQLSSAPNLETFLKVVVGVIKDLTQFHRVLIYQFDEAWNGQVVAELVDWRQTHDLYKGLHFPAADIPAQARELYRINKVRLLYNLTQPTARLVIRDRNDLETPLDMTRSFLRAMSPIHLKYLSNMSVRSSMSISIVVFGALWGLIACHSYGSQGMRVSFPVREMLRLLSDSVSRNIERLSYAQRLHTRKLISTLPTDAHPTGYIISNAEDLLGLFDADFGVLVIGDGAKILGPNHHGQEISIVAEYLRLKRFTILQVSQSVAKDFPDLRLPSGNEVVAGLLCVPLSKEGKDFIAFLRKGQLRDVHWAGKPYKSGIGTEAILEPRKSFKIWSETIAGRSREWTDEQLETAGVLALVYGKFIDVWRQKESVLQTTQLTNLLLSNASHEVRTPLNHIINYLEMALNGPLDSETRENLVRSHSASKSLLFTINDLLDLTRLEQGNETSFSEPFDLHNTIADAVYLYRTEAARRNLHFNLDVKDCPNKVIGDAKKIRTVVANLTANALKYTNEGSISVSCHRFVEPLGLREQREVAVEIVVADTGCGIDNERLESIFREFEQIESSVPKPPETPGLGLGLAIVARIVEQLGGQLRVDSRPGSGSRFSFLVPFELAPEDSSPTSSVPRQRVRTTSDHSSELNSIVEALSTDHMSKQSPPHSPAGAQSHLHAQPPPRYPPVDGKFDVVGSKYPIRSLKVDGCGLDNALSIGTHTPGESSSGSKTAVGATIGNTSVDCHSQPLDTKLRVLIVEDDAINRTVLAKRLLLDGHHVVCTTNGQECVQLFEKDRDFDCILMDIQMPILDGFQATQQIRTIEGRTPHFTLPPTPAVSPPTPPSANPHHQTQSPRVLPKHRTKHVPIFAVSASLLERQRNDLITLGIDGWILKPIDFKRLRVFLQGIVDVVQRERNLYHPGCNWEAGGWLADSKGN